MYHQDQVLSNDQLMRVAPSVFATEAYKEMSDKYTFIPTIQIVDALRNEGFMPVRAAQSRTRIPGKAEFTKHMLRFRRAEDLQTRGRQVGEEIPELVLVNAHDGRSTYQLSGGIFRVWCANGAVVKSATLGDINVRHTGNIADDVIEGSYTIIDEMPKILNRVQEFKGIALKPEQQLAYATAAMELRYPHSDDQESRSPIIPEQLLNVRRSADTANDVWTTFNRVQENFMRGGLRGIGTTGRRMRTRKIASVNEDLKLNKALWMLTEKMAELAK